MKLVFIVGATSCGKTTFVNTNYQNKNILSLDALSKSVRSVFTDFKLYDKNICIKPSVNSDKFLNLVKKYVECFFYDYPNETLVVEGCHFAPTELLTAFPDAKIIALGITDKDIALSQINKKDWMAKLKDSEKIAYVDLIVNYSLELKKNQGDYQYIEFYEDTFKDW